MKALIFSDWHLDNYTNFDLCKKSIDNMIPVLKKILINKETLLIILCGDIINQGKLQMFDLASQIIQYILNKFSDYDLLLTAIPGNHDFSETDKSFSHFDNCINKYSCVTHNFENEPTYSLYINGYNFIFTNSAYSKDWRKGDIQSSSIYKQLKDDATNILIAHHGITGINQEDKSMISDAQTLFDICNQGKLNYFIHGHSHERNYTKVLCNGLNIIGIGPAFKLSNADTQQFLIIDFENKTLSFCPYVFSESQNKYEPLLGFSQESIDLFNYQEAKNKMLQRFEPLSNYFSRKAVEYDRLTGSAYELYLGESKSRTLTEYCLNNKLVVLLGDAGSGKTFELKHFYQTLLKNDSAYLPIFIELRNYADQPIEKLIPAEVNGADINKCFLIFDGLDEIESSKIKTFARYLNNFTISNNDIHILVSSRSNFYFNATDNNKNGTLNNFTEIGLYPISKEFIRNLCNNDNLNFKKFHAEANKQGINDLINNPFYLMDLIKIYRQNEHLPSKISIMDHLIGTRFKVDELKYYYSSIDIEERVTELNSLLNKIAFSMQCLGKNYFTDAEYQCLFDYNQRSLAKYSGLIKKNIDKWEFSHNNFREYLSARFLVDKSLDYILSIITLPDNNNVIRNSWFNVFSYLVLIYKNDELLNWIKKNNPEKLIKFEINRISVKTRKEIFISIFEDISNKNIWISHAIDSISEYAQFGQDKDNINYLLKQVISYKHFRQQANALTILGEMDIKLFNMDIDVKNVIMKCIKSKNVRNYEKQIAIRILSETNICDKQTLLKILEIFGKEYDPYIRCDIYDLILTTNSIDENLDFILDELRHRNSIKYESYASLDFRINEVLSTIKSSNSIIKILRLFSEKYQFDLIHDLEKILNTVIDKAITQYNKHPELFDEVLKLFITAEKEYDHKIIPLCVSFFKQTKTLYNAYIYLIDNDSLDYINLILDDIMDDICENDMANRYKNHTLKKPETFIWMVQRRANKCNKYEEFKKLIKETEGLELAEKEQVDYDRIRKSGEVIYFNSLFNKKDYIKLIYELLDAYGDIEIDNKSISKSSFKNENMRYDLDLVKWDIYHASEKPIKILQLIDKIRWDNYLYYKIFKFLHNNTKYVPNKEQLEKIYSLCQDTIKIINPEKEITYHQNKVQFTYRIQALSYLSARFDFEYNENLMTKFLYIPSYFFIGHGVITYEFPEYAINNIPNEIIYKWVLDKIENGTPVGELALVLINYCKLNQIDCACALAQKLLNNKELTEYEKRYCIEYLQLIKGDTYVCDYLLPTDDSSIINTLKAVQIVDNDSFKKLLININEKSENNISELPYLFKMDCEYAINKYLSICKNLNQIPDYSKNNNVYAYCTEALANISDIKFLPQIEELLILCNSPDFKDKEHFGLNHSLNNIIKNLALQDHDKIENMLNKLINKYPENSDLICSCNYYLLDINYALYQASDKPFDFKYIQEQIK